MPTLKSIATDSLQSGDLNKWGEGQEQFVDDAISSGKETGHGPDDLRRIFRSSLDTVTNRYEEGVDPNADSDFSKVALEKALPEILGNDLAPQQMYEDVRLTTEIVLDILVNAGELSPADVVEVRSKISPQIILARIKGDKNFSRYAGRFEQYVVSNAEKYVEPVSIGQIARTRIAIEIARSAWATRTVYRQDESKLDDPSFVTTPELAIQTFQKDVGASLTQRVADAVMLLWSDATQVAKTSLVTTAQ